MRKTKPKDEVLMIERIGDRVRTLYASGKVRFRKKKQFLLGV